jgi:hypothetical protein
MGQQQFLPSTRAYFNNPLSHRESAGTLCLALVVLLGAGVAAAIEVEGITTYHEAPPRQPPLFHRIEKLDPSLAVLPPAAIGAADRLEKMHRHNSHQPVVPQNGFRREIPELTVNLGSKSLSAVSRGGSFVGGAVMVEDETLVWTARLQVSDAYAFRIHLQEVELTPGAKIWVYGSKDEFRGPFDRAHLDPEGSIWLPAIFDSRAYLQVHVPLAELGVSEPVRFRLGEIMELFDLAEPELKVWTDCDIDRSCAGRDAPPSAGSAMLGVALLTFNDDGKSYQCTGALIRSFGQRSEIPYLLTANHCFDTQASASTLTAYFEYYVDECDGEAPALSEVAQVSGATLLTTSPKNDHTFVKLNAIPEGWSHYFGWTTETPLEPQQLYRVSHPDGAPQKYSASRFLDSEGIPASEEILCDSKPRPHFHYSYGELGSTSGGSSGSPLFTYFGYIVGQQYGVCHYENWDECDYSTFNYIDGSFATTFSYVSDFLLAGPECPADAYETQGSKGLAGETTDDTCHGARIDLGRPQTHTFCDEDWVWFHGKAGAAYRIELTDLTGDLHPFTVNIGLHRGCGEMLDGDVGGLYEFLATEDARYDVRIFMDSPSGYVNGYGYTITVTCLSNCQDEIFKDGFESGDLSEWK